MKTQYLRPAVVALSFNLLLMAMACHRRAQPGPEPAVRRYEVKGRVETLDLGGRRVTIAHQEIKGYMDAMTMSFAVKDENLLQGLKSGDQVEATLVYDSSTNLSWLEDLKRSP
ncbi:MAG TPA: copper-binding protein [Blastocatellia bacterium]|nr:copper-binding protein [Blastocatellia bacterium]